MIYYNKRKELFSIKIVGTIETLADFPTVAEVDDVVFCKEDNKPYIYYDEGLGKSFGWRECTKELSGATINTGMTEYEINSIIISQMPSLITDAQLKNAKELLYNYIHDDWVVPGYYMLLCNDLRYYTVFIIEEDNELEKAEDVIVECLQNIGAIQYVDYNTDKSAIECWVKNDKGCFMFMLFNYGWGIVTCQ